MKNQLFNIAYLRCSTDEQDVTHQLSSIEKFCESQNIVIDKVVKDEGVSAYSKSAYERKGFSEIIHLAEENKINKLILFESSRLSRNFHEGQNLIKFFSDKRVEIYSVVDGGIINATEVDELLNSIRYWINQKASKETSDRIKSQKKLAKSKGEFLGHPVPLGFKIENKHEIIDEDKRNFIIELFNTYINQSSRACIDLLKTIGIKANHQTLLQRIKNDKYIQIVGEDIFNKAQETIQSRRCSKGNNTRTLNRSNILYEGLLYHLCGSKLTIDKNRKGEPVFRCRRCKHNLDINIKKSFIGNPLMNNINKDMYEIINNLDRNKLEEKYKERNNKQRSIISYKIHEIKASIKSKKKSYALANNKLEKILISDMDDSLISTVANTVNNIKKEIEELEKELNIEQEKIDTIDEQTKFNDSLINKIINLKDVYINGSDKKKKAILNFMIDKVIVYDIDKFDIFLKI